MSTASRAAPQRLSGAITVPAFAFSRIRYPQYHSAAPCGSAYPAAGCPEVEEVYGAYRVLETEDRIGLGSPCPPAALSAHGRDTGSPDARCGAFWLRPRSTFGRLRVTTFNRSSHVLAMPSTLVPRRLVLAATPAPRGLGAPKRMGYIVRGLPTVRYLAAVPRRVRMMGHPVTSSPSV